MGLFGAIGGFLGGVCSFIGSVCSAIGGAIMAGISALATTLAPWLPVIGTVIQFIGKLCGTLKEDDNIEDFGEAMTLADKKPEYFDSINDYIDYLRNEISSGNIKLNENRNIYQKIAYQSMGYALSIKGIDEKYGLQSSDEFWAAMGKSLQDNKITKEEVGSLLESAKEKEVSTENIANYIKGEKLEDNVKPAEVSGAIESALEKANPEASKDDIESRFNELLKSGKSTE